MSSVIIAKHIVLLHHTLGLSPERRVPFRNHFMAGDGHHDQAALLELQAAGLMTRAAAPEWMGGGDCFRVTDEGKSLALDRLPPPPKYSRYEQYLRSECCESFAEWLGIELPEREPSYNYRTPNHFRLKSSRAAGDYALTMKEAKASYKAALAARRAEAKAWKEAVPC
jgi:hypothetical protein